MELLVFLPRPQAQCQTSFIAVRFFVLRSPPACNGCFLVSPLPTVYSLSNPPFGQILIRVFLIPVSLSPATLTQERPVHPFDVITARDLALFPVVMTGVCPVAENIVVFACSGFYLDSYQKGF